MTRWPSTVEADAPLGVVASYKGPTNVSATGDPSVLEVELDRDSIMRGNAGSAAEATVVEAVIGVTVSFEEVA
jgi:hypothetical protein